MNNFDFHNLLFPSEFEKFCKEIIEVREVGLTFTTYPSGRDGGIDIRATNTDKIIIGQCKLYATQHKKKFISGLKSELEKCKKLGAQRYILCTNLNLLPNEAKDILQSFKGYIHCEEDIVDGIKLNSYLNQKPYEHLFKVYSKLLVPNFKKIELALEDIIYRKYINKTKVYLHKIKEKHKLFHNTAQLPHLIEQLEQNKVIILSGNPGVGKTTTALMIANYFLTKKVNEFIFLEEYDFKETLGLAKEDQIIIADDFWGQNFSPTKDSHLDYQREFKTIIKHFETSKNNYLILTSRDYVIKDLLATADIDTKDTVNSNKYTIRLEEISFDDKIRIFYNHLLFYNFEPSYFNHTKYDQSFLDIINNENYSPRHLDFFIKKFRKEKYQNSFIFYGELAKYIRDPREYWNSVFHRLTPTAKLILLILFCSGDRMNEQDLNKSFNSCHMDARRIVHLDINPLDYPKELVKLEEFYIYIEKNKHYNCTLISFRSPGIKDYLLEYLRSDGYAWIEPILINAPFFNQLTFLFSVENKDLIPDEESNYSIYGNRIHLNETLAEILKQRFITDYKKLDFSNYENRNYLGNFSRFYSLEESRYFKLYEITRFFPIDRTENAAIRYFLLEQISADIDTHNRSGTMLHDLSLWYLPIILKSALPFWKIDPLKTISFFHKNISFSSGFYFFMQFRELFPIEFDTYYRHHQKAIKHEFKEFLFDEIEYYLDNDYRERLDRLIDVTMDEISHMYMINFDEEGLRDIERYFGINILYDFSEQNIETDHKEEFEDDIVNKHATPSQLIALIDEYIPAIKDDDESGNVHDYPLAVRNMLECNLALFKDITDCEEILSKIIDLDFVKTIDLSETNVSNILECLLSEHCVSLNVSYAKIIELYYTILSSSDESYKTGPVIETIIKESRIPNVSIEDLHPIVVADKNWFRFANRNIEKFITASSINLEDSDFEYCERTMDESFMSDEITIYKYLEEINPVRFTDAYLSPQLKRLLDNIDFTNEKTIFFSFLNFFEIELEITLNNDGSKLEDGVSNGANFWYYLIFEYLGMNYSESDILIYFLQDYHREENTKHLTINNEFVVELSQALINKKYTKEERHYSLMKTPIEEITFKPSDFFQDSDCYELAVKVGMIGHVLNLIGRVQSFLK